eukprot:CAMPEP_0175148730 /NCGR_PEP_ID=MMETSP0087-20121206/16804_1 /TAXON_ID=136419 /ORGANISM="Unknown Unknown, Strain D1" /LENGTH=741 /DNA_ID=CAMNT_0016434251 /DNA_START=242 /DNA_END=2467 /DNA_ORIENTATION=-
MINAMRKAQVFHPERKENQISPRQTYRPNKNSARQPALPLHPLEAGVAFQQSMLKSNPRYDAAPFVTSTLSQSNTPSMGTRRLLEGRKPPVRKKPMASFKLSSLSKPKAITVRSVQYEEDEKEDVFQLTSARKMLANTAESRSRPSSGALQVNREYKMKQTMITSASTTALVPLDEYSDSDDSTLDDTDFSCREFLKQSGYIPRSKSPKIYQRPHQKFIHPKRRFQPGQSLTPCRSMPQLLRPVKTDTMYGQRDMVDVIRHKIDNKFYGEGDDIVETEVLMRALVPPLEIPFTDHRMRTEFSSSMSMLTERPGSREKVEVVIKNEYVAPKLKFKLPKEEEIDWEPPANYNQQEYCWYPMEDLKSSEKRKQFENDWLEANQKLKDIVTNDDERTAMKETMWEHYQCARELFAFYSSFGCTDSMLGMMSSASFSQFIKACKLLGGPINVTTVSKIFAEVNVEDAEDVLGTNDDNPDKFFTRSEFVESLARLALIKFKGKGHGEGTETPAGKLEKLFKAHVTRYGLKHINITPGLRPWLATNKPLQKLFCENGAILQERYNAYASHATARPDAMDVGELDMILSDFELVDSNFSRRTAITCFCLAKDETESDMVLSYPAYLEFLCRAAEQKYCKSDPKLRLSVAVSQLVAILVGPKRNENPTEVKLDYNKRRKKKPAAMMKNAMGALKMGMAIAKATGTENAFAAEMQADAPSGGAGKPKMGLAHMLAAASMAAKENQESGAES